MFGLGIKCIQQLHAQRKQRHSRHMADNRHGIHYVIPHEQMGGKNNTTIKRAPLNTVPTCKAHHFGFMTRVLTTYCILTIKSVDSSTVFGQLLMKDNLKAGNRMYPRMQHVPLASVSSHWKLERCRHSCSSTSCTLSFYLSPLSLLLLLLLHALVWFVRPVLLAMHHAGPK